MKQTTDPNIEQLKAQVEKLIRYYKTNMSSPAFRPVNIKLNCERKLTDKQVHMVLHEIFKNYDEFDYKYGVTCNGLLEIIV